ncbi:hypothetical protein TrCOL_g2136 [Triparma columacea]|uniref:Tyrosine-protein kinase ephrin type A/B receptor-like domain-containing protein n=1 Tax=Triparma columacea TaxID=722753 RepID=A0A9W7GI38_9STRA|nr:hypothetical protein TrCOL_g2136 [Triparma columacea]
MNNFHFFLLFSLLISVLHASIAIVVSDIDDLYDNLDSSGSNTVTNGQTTTLTALSYKCSDAQVASTCGSSESMVEMTTGLSGTVACETDAASCILDAEKTKRAMKIHGPNTVDEVLTLRALTIKDGAYDDGGGLHLREDCVVVLLLCVFVDCRNNVNDDSRAIYLSNAAHSSNSGATTTHIIIRGTRIHSNIKVESGSDIYVSDGALEIMSTCPSPYSNPPTEGATLSIAKDSTQGAIIGAANNYFCHYICLPGYYNPTLGSASDSCVVCPSGQISPMGSTICLDDDTYSTVHSVSNMDGVFNKISNFGDLGNSIGNSIMNGGDATELAVSTYKCSDGGGGTGVGGCASSGVMFYTINLWGLITCSSYTAGCILDGERDIQPSTGRLCIIMRGTDQKPFTFRALTIKDFWVSRSAMWLRYDNSIVEIQFCIFTNNQNTHSNLGGEAIFVDADLTLDVHGSSFVDNALETDEIKNYQDKGTGGRIGYGTQRYLRFPLFLLLLLRLSSWLLQSDSWQYEHLLPGMSYRN